MANGIFDSNDAATPAVSATGTNGADGVNASSDSGNAVTANSTNGAGILSFSINGTGIFGTTGSGNPGNPAVQGEGGAIGVLGRSFNGTGVFAGSSNLVGLHAVSGSGSDALTPPTTAAAIFAEGGSNPGIVAQSPNSTAMRALSGDPNSYTSIAIGRIADEGRIGVAAAAGQFANDAVAGDIILRTETPSQHLLLGLGPDNSTMAISNEIVAVTVTGKPLSAGGGQTAVLATSDFGVGVIGSSASGTGVDGSSDAGTGVLGFSRTGRAGFFSGNVEVTGFLFKDNGGFQIDHPLDPAGKYLFHSFVESPDMKNIYDGVVVLDAQGEAEVTLPSWFDALNTDFRYQLTAIGASGPDLYIAEEIRTNRFKIAGGKPHMKVCWQVTGVRQDALAKAHPIPVEQDKPTQEQGYYRHPELYGESEQKSIVRARYPELK
jgi:hypothetical protein